MSTCTSHIDKDNRLVDCSPNSDPTLSNQKSCQQRKKQICISLRTQKTESIISKKSISNLSAVDQIFFEEYGLGPSIELPYQTINAPIERQGLINPTVVAVQEGDQSLQYDELNFQANRLANHLSLYGISNHDCVGLFLDRSVSMAVGILGVLKTGSAFAPLDVNFTPVHQIKNFIAITRAKVVLTLAKHLEVLPRDVSCVYVCIDELLSSPVTADELKRYRPENEILPNHSSFLVFSAEPSDTLRGIQVTHRNICNFVLSSSGNLGIETGDKVAQLVNNSVELAVWETLSTLANGGTLLLSRGDFTDAASKADILVTSPDILSLIESAQCENLKTVAIAGGRCPKKLADEWASFCDFYNTFGTAETTIVNTMDQHDSDGDLSLGFPTPNNSVYILNEFGEPSAIGEVGEIWIGGDCVSAGYFKNASLTSERFKYDKFLRGRRMMFNTRELGRWTKYGCLQYVGKAVG